MVADKSLLIVSGTPLIRETPAMRLKDLREENNKLKTLLAEQMLDYTGLKGLALSNSSARNFVASGGSMSPDFDLYL